MPGLPDPGLPQMLLSIHREGGHQPAAGTSQAGQPQTPDRGEGLMPAEVTRAVSRRSWVKCEQGHQNDIQERLGPDQLGQTTGPSGMPSLPGCLEDLFLPQAWVS